MPAAKVHAILHAMQYERPCISNGRLRVIQSPTDTRGDCINSATVHEHVQYLGSASWRRLVAS
jgi:hypothetical protein